MAGFEAARKTGANATMIFVPPAFAADAIMEAADAGIAVISNASSRGMNCHLNPGTGIDVEYMRRRGAVACLGLVLLPRDRL